MVFPAGFLGNFFQLAGGVGSNPLFAALSADAGRYVPHHDQRKT